MSTLAAVAPAGAGAGAIIGYLGSLLLFALAVALTVLWVQILRGPLIRLAALSVLHVHPFGWLNTVVTNVDHWLKAAEEGGERGMTWSLHSLMWSLSTTARLTADLAQATWQGQKWLRHHTTRQVGAQAGQSISPRVKTLEREYKGIDQRLDRIEHREQGKRAVGAAAGAQDFSLLRRGIDRLSKRVGHLAHELDAVEHAQAHAGAKAKPGEVAVPRVAPRVVPRSRSAARHWTDVLTRAAAASLVIAAFARLGLGWLRCSNVKKVGKAVCGMDARLLESLLLDALALTVAFNLRTFAEELQDVTKEAADLIHRFAD